MGAIQVRSYPQNSEHERRRARPRRRRLPPWKIILVGKVVELVPRLAYVGQRDPWHRESASAGHRAHRGHDHDRRSDLTVGTGAE